MQRRYGGPEVLEFADIPRPKVGADEVLVRVVAAGVDRGVWHLMTGLPYLVRLAGYGVRAPKNPVPGMDVAGVVETVGDAVDGFRAGDEVFGVARGSFAEFACARADRLVAKPANVDAVQVAATPVSGLAALQAVRDHGRVQAGQRVLVVGASGGVGTFAVQLAKIRGAHVTGVCSTAKLDLVRALGADAVIDYTREEITTGGQRFDVILDIAGNRPLSVLRRALTPAGRLVIVGGENGGRWVGGVDRQVRAQLISPFVPQTLGAFLSKETPTDLDSLAGLLADGSLTPAVDRTYPLVDAARALEHLTDGGSRGKTALTL